MYYDDYTAFCEIAKQYVVAGRQCGSDGLAIGQQPCVAHKADDLGLKQQVLDEHAGKRAKALISQFLDFLEGRSGLLIARDLKERYAFPHKTFQEYLAARELVYLGDQELLKQTIAYRHAPDWREVILLAVGQLVATGSPDRARQMGWKLLDADAEDSEGHRRSAALAGELVAELRGNLGSDGRALQKEVVGARCASVVAVHRRHCHTRARSTVTVLDRTRWLHPVVNDQIGNAREVPLVVCDQRQLKAQCSGGDQQVCVFE